MHDFKDAALTIALKKEGNTVTMAWLGQSTIKDPSAELLPYLQSVIAEVKGCEMVVQYNQLAYMNSSTVKVILQLVSGLNAAGVKTTVTYDRNSSWQRTSFKVMQGFILRMPYISIQAQ